MTNTGKVNILLVDDQPSKLLTYETILRDLGENLLKASSATEALECLLKNEIAVILVDVCMPDLDGYELAAMIRQHPRYQKTSIIFVSAVLMTDLDRLRGYECGAVDYVPVPVIPEILRAKVSVFAELYRKTRQLESLNRELEERVAERTAALESTTTALQEADRKKDEFLAMLAHELRNPLAPIRTAAHLMRLKELPDARREKARSIIERQVEHLVRLVDDLLDVSRITRGLITLQREDVEIGAVVARAIETNRPLIDARCHTLTVDLPERPSIVHGDMTRLAQVVANILHNSAKFTDDRGTIALSVRRESDDVVVIRVRDNGSGIRQDLLPKVFDLFVQANGANDGDAARSQSGLGLGLALVRRLVELHGGTVNASSDGPGHGTEVVVRLPLVRRPADVFPAQEPSPMERSVMSRRVLVVDDNSDAAETMAVMLETAGHDVRIAYDGLEAVTVASEFLPDVVLLDLGMPKMDGYAAARIMRQQPWGGRVVLIAVTGWGQPQDLQRTSEAGFDVHLVKPVGEAELTNALARSAHQIKEGISSSARSYR